MWGEEAQQSRRLYVISCVCTHKKLDLKISLNCSGVRISMNKYFRSVVYGLWVSEWLFSLGIQSRYDILHGGLPRAWYCVLVSQFGLLF